MEVPLCLLCSVSKLAILRQTNLFIKNSASFRYIPVRPDLRFKSHFLRNTDKAWKWCLQIFFIFSYFVLNDDIWHLVNFFPKISTCSQDIGAHILVLLGQKVTHWMKLLLWKQIYVSRALLKHFFFHFLKIWAELYKKKQILTFLCLLLSRNHGPKPQKAEFLSNFETSYLSWPSLGHTFFWFLWKPFWGANTQWSKNHVQVRAWDRVITQNSTFIQKLLCNAAHNGSGLRSGAKCKYSIVCSNMVLSGKRNSTMCSSALDPTEALEIALFCSNYSY